MQETACQRRSVPKERMLAGFEQLRGIERTVDRKHYAPCRGWSCAGLNFRNIRRINANFLRQLTRADAAFFSNLAQQFSIERICASLFLQIPLPPLYIEYDSIVNHIHIVSLECALRKCKKT